MKDSHTNSYVSKLWKTPQNQMSDDQNMVDIFMEPSLRSIMMAIAIGDFVKEISL